MCCPLRKLRKASADLHLYFHRHGSRPLCRRSGAEPLGQQSIFSDSLCHFRHCFDLRILLQNQISKSKTKKILHQRFHLKSRVALYVQHDISHDSLWGSHRILFYFGAGKNLMSFLPYFYICLVIGMLLSKISTQKMIDAGKHRVLLYILSLIHI